MTGRPTDDPHTRAHVKLSDRGLGTRLTPDDPRLQLLPGCYLVVVARARPAGAAEPSEDVVDVVRPVVDFRGVVRFAVASFVSGRPAAAASAAFVTVLVAGRVPASAVAAPAAGCGRPRSWLTSRTTPPATTRTGHSTKPTIPAPTAATVTSALAPLRRRKPSPSALIRKLVVGPGGSDVAEP